MATAKEIPPGGEGKIDVTFKTGSGSSGKRQKHISVSTNDPGNKNVRLTVSATVVEKIGISPSRINFNQVKKGKQHVRYASLSGEDKDTTKLTGADSPNPNIQVELNPQGYDGDKYRQIKIILLPTIRTGRFFERVTIHTDHKEAKDIPVNVIGDVTGDIALIPSQLHFGLFQQGSEVKRVIRVKAVESVSFKILEVKSTIPEVTASVETVTAGSEYRIHAQLKNSFTGNSLKGALLIRTDLKDYTELEVEIAGRKLPRQAPKPEAGGAAPAVRHQQNFTVFPPVDSTAKKPVKIYENLPPQKAPVITPPLPAGRQ